MGYTGGGWDGLQPLGWDDGGDDDIPVCYRDFCKDTDCHNHPNLCFDRSESFCYQVPEYTSIQWPAIGLPAHGITGQGHSALCWAPPAGAADDLDGWKGTTPTFMGECCLGPDVGEWVANDASVLGLPHEALPSCSDGKVKTGSGEIEGICGSEALCTDTPIFGLAPTSPPAPPVPRCRRQPRAGDRHQRDRPGSMTACGARRRRRRQGLDRAAQSDGFGGQPARLGGL